MPRIAPCKCVACIYHDGAESCRLSQNVPLDEEGRCERRTEKK